MARLFSLSRLPACVCSCEAPFLHSSPNPCALRSLSVSSPKKKPPKHRTLLVSFSLAESNSPKSLDGGGTGGQQGSDDDDVLPLLRQLSMADTLQECLLLPPDFLSRLPRDLRLDLNDAAFDLSNGPVLDECGEVLGEFLLNLSKAWEKADTSTSNSLAMQLQSMQRFFTDNVKASFGKRLVSAGRRFQAMGQYGDGETQKIATAMIKIGKLLSRGSVIKSVEKSKMEIRTFKFGELQVELTSKKAYIGAGIGLVFGLLSWKLSQGIESIPESSLQYANDNALLLAKSLRGALLALFYSCTVLAAFASIGLLFYGRELSSEGK